MWVRSQHRKAVLGWTVDTWNTHRELIPLSLSIGLPQGILLERFPFGFPP